MDEVVLVATTDMISIYDMGIINKDDEQDELMRENYDAELTFARVKKVKVGTNCYGIQRWISSLYMSHGEDDKYSLHTPTKTTGNTLNFLSGPFLPSLNVPSIALNPLLQGNNQAI